MPPNEAPAASPALQDDAVPLTAPPHEGQNVLHEGTTYTTIREGLAHILVPPGLSTSTDPKDPSQNKQSVFYNPIQQFNRDLSVLSIRAHGEDMLARRQAKITSRAGSGKRRGKQRGRRQERDEAVEELGDEGAAKRLKTGADGQFVPVQESNGTADQDQNQATVATDLMDDSKGEAEETGEAKMNGTERPEGEAATASSKSPRQPTFRILDALSATGLRALRYSNEIPFVTSVTANDMSKTATDSIVLNAKHNGLEEKIQVNTGNALAHMYNLATHGERPGSNPKYDVIDLDPYGTAAPFIDAALQALNDGGMLCVTCTDSGVFASVGYLEKAYALYGGLPVKGVHCHEGGLRLILHAIATSAARYGICIEPLLSLSIDYYARVFVRIRKSPTDVKLLAGKIMHVYACDHGCGAWQTQYLARNEKIENKNGSTYYKYHAAQAPTASSHCEHCGKKTHMQGPMWGGPLHNPAFIKLVLSYLPTLDPNVYGTIDRLDGMLQTALDELVYQDKSPEAKDPSILVPRVDPAELERTPFYIMPSSLTRILRSQAPSDAALRGALRHAGYKATRSHAKRGTIKTDAGWDVIWEILREWVRQRAPIREGALGKKTSGWTIMERSKRGKEVDGGGVDNTDAASMQSSHDGNSAPASPPSKAEENQPSEGEEKGATREKSGSVALTERKKPLHLMDVVFDEQLGTDKDTRKLRRYQQNPRENWGPMSRAK